MMKDKINNLDITYKSFSEVYDIINHLEIELYNKIPIKFIKSIEQNRDTEYKPNIDYSKSINDQDLLDETRVILSLIYRDYICLPDKKSQLLQKDKEELFKIENELQEKYNVDNLFNKKFKTVNEIKNNQLDNTDLPVVKNKGFIFRIIEKIKDFFRKKR